MSKSNLGQFNLTESTENLTKKSFFHYAKETWEHKKKRFER